MDRAARNNLTPIDPSNRRRHHLRTVRQLFLCQPRHLAQSPHSSSLLWTTSVRTLLHRLGGAISSGT